MKILNRNFPETHAKPNISNYVTMLLITLGSLLYLKFIYDISDGISFILWLFFIFYVIRGVISIYVISVLLQYLNIENSKFNGEDRGILDSINYISEWPFGVGIIQLELGNIISSVVLIYYLYPISPSLSGLCAFNILSYIMVQYLHAKSTIRALEHRMGENS